MLKETIDPIIHWLHLHPHWAGIVTFIISFSETLVVIGSLIPGSVMMTAIGGLIGLGVIPLGATLMWAIAGAIVGDGFSFWLGYRYHEHIRDAWPLNRMPHWLAKGEAFFDKHGGKSIFIGRFVGPVRAFLPIIGGMMRLNPTRYIIANVSSAVLWAPAYLLPGYLIGTATKTLPPEIALKFIGIVLGILLAIWASAWLTNKLIAWLYNKCDACIESYHKRIMKTDNTLIKLILRDTASPQSHRQLSTLLLALSCAILFCVLTLHVLFHGPLTSWNNPLWYLLRSVRSDHLQQILILVTYLGEKKILLFVWLSIFILLLKRNHWYVAMHWLVMPVLSASIIQIIKHCVASPRPSGLILPPSGYSFPSGHATLSTTFYAMIAVLLSEQLPKYRRFIYTSTAVIILSVCFSRLYLGAHWLTDVCGGVLLGLMCVSLTTLSLRHERYRPTSSKAIFITFTASLFLAWSGYAFFKYDKNIYGYHLKWTIHKISSEQWWTNDGTAVPYYRHTRTGHKAELLNVQWYATLADIKASLLKRGWETPPSKSFSQTLIKLTSKKQNHHLPILHQLYLDHKPSLLLVKPIDPKQENKYYLVLRLWKSGLEIIESGETLWVGTIGFSDRTHPEYVSTRLVQDKNDKHITMSATKMLARDLHDFKSKRVAIVQRWQLPSHKYGHQYALLVKQ